MDAQAHVCCIYCTACSSMRREHEAMWCGYRHRWKEALEITFVDQRKQFDQRQSCIKEGRWSGQVSVSGCAWETQCKQGLSWMRALRRGSGWGQLLRENFKCAVLNPPSRKVTERRFALKRFFGLRNVTIRCISRKSLNIVLDPVIRRTNPLRCLSGHMHLEQEGARVQCRANIWCCIM